MGDRDQRGCACVCQVRLLMFDLIDGTPWQSWVSGRLLAPLQQPLRFASVWSLRRDSVRHSCPCLATPKRLRSLKFTSPSQSDEVQCSAVQCNRCRVGRPHHWQTTIGSARMAGGRAATPSAAPLATNWVHAHTHTHTAQCSCHASASALTQLGVCDCKWIGSKWNRKKRRKKKGAAVETLFRRRF